MRTGLLAPDRDWDAAVNDPFLRAHQIGVRMLEIGPRLSPLSIRDQMFRAAVAIDRACEHRLISKESPILIVGGGAAGGAAAARAIRYGIEVFLVESNPYLFYRQDRCPTRWVSPTQYDWPAPHAGEHEYPWHSIPSKENIELPWRAAFGEELAAQWNLALRASQLRRDSGELHVLTSTDFEDALIHQTTRGVRIQARVKLRPKARRFLELPLFSLLLFAMGLGDEQCVVDGHGGPAFWAEDSFDRPQLGLKRKPRVLVSGGGDGALQDFIRLVTGKKSALEVYEGFNLPEPAKARLEKAITWAEDHWQRSAVWSTKRWDCKLLHNLHVGYAEQIEALPPEFWERQPALRVPGEFDIKLIHSCDHFGPCYALNHFVALALCKLLEKKGLHPIQQGRRVTKIEGGSCGKLGCQGHSHQVSSIESECGRARGSQVFDEGVFNVLVLRHGIAPPNPLANAPTTQIRQMLPSHNPWGVEV